jgi:hypothetical protein
MLVGSIPIPACTLMICGLLWPVRGVDLNLLQLLALLLQAEATAPINGDREQVLEPTSHSLQEKGFYVNV